MTKTFKVQNGDILFSSANGRPLSIEGREKLSQDIKENLEIEQLPDGTGAGLDALIGVIGDSYSLRAELSRRLNVSAEALKKLQNTIQQFDRTRNEKIARIVAINIFPLANQNSSKIEQTSFAYRIDFLSEEGEASLITGTISA